MSRWLKHKRAACGPAAAYAGSDGVEARDSCVVVHAL